jgi:hypothetical protein
MAAAAIEPLREKVNLIAQLLRRAQDPLPGVGEILPLLLSARETTARETPARWATSCAVTLCLRGLNSCRAFLAEITGALSGIAGRHD